MVRPSPRSTHPYHKEIFGFLLFLHHLDHHELAEEESRSNELSEREVGHTRTNHTADQEFSKVSILRIYKEQPYFGGHAGGWKGGNNKTTRRQFC